MQAAQLHDIKTQKARSERRYDKLSERVEAVHVVCAALPESHLAATASAVLLQPNGMPRPLILKA